MREQTVKVGSEFWKAGRVTGWMEALMENCPQTFRRFIPEERMGVLHEAY